MPESDSPSLFSSSARSLPHRRPYLRAVFFTLLHYVTFFGALALAWLLYRERDHTILVPFVAGGCAVPVTWTLSHLARRYARCPLCQGTPLLDSSAAKHRKALRLGPLNYGTSAVLHLALTRRFRCMYCGTPYNLRKKSRLRPQDRP